MTLKEEDLYPPVKAFLERQGYTVKGEVRGCDLVAVRADDAKENPAAPVVVELKLSLTLPLLLQAVDRLKMTDSVYLAFPRPKGRNNTLTRHRREVLALCKRLGIGLLLIDPSMLTRKRVANPLAVEAVLDPLPYAPRKVKRRTTLLLREFSHRVGDPNKGGITKRPIVTAYRQRTLMLAATLAREVEASPKTLREITGVEKAATMLRNDVYGWFHRVDRGVYTLSPKGLEALKTFSDVVEALEAA
ncbi:MAG: DUF2161 family putative PD-(D/E)XK-type phosphodiesterase [Pseudomonadota bacterium]